LEAVIENLVKRARNNAEDAWVKVSIGAKVKFKLQDVVKP